MDAPATVAQRNRTVAEGPDGVKALLAAKLGPSSWHQITQQRVNQFAAATGDNQWIHVDPERAAGGPFGGPIAHGYLTLSLTPVVLGEILDVRGFSMAVNYGCDRVRFPSPVPVGSRIRGSAVVDTVQDVPGGVQLGLTLTFEIENGSKPVCVASIVVRHYA